MEGFDNLTGHEKGVIARALLVCIIEQARFGARQDVDGDHEIIVRLKPWQLKVLKFFHRPQT